MIYKDIMEGRKRSYKSLGQWGLACNIDTLPMTFRASVDICYKNDIVTVASADFNSMASAKMWCTRYVQRLIGELERWTAKKI